MGNFDAPQVKAFFLTFGIDLEDIFLTWFATVVIDLDMLLYKFIEIGLRTVQLINNDFEMYYKDFTDLFVDFLAKTLLFYSRFDRTYQVKIVLFLYSFSEEKSPCNRLKKLTREKRGKWGYKKRRDDDEMPFWNESDPLKWIGIPNVNKQRLMQTKEFMVALFNVLLPCAVPLIQTMVSTNDFENRGDHWKYVKRHMQLDEIIFYGFNNRVCFIPMHPDACLELHYAIGMKYFGHRIVFPGNAMYADENQCYPEFVEYMDAMVDAHSGEADLFMYNMPMLLDYLRTHYTIILESGDTDTFAIFLNYGESFPYGFYLNNGPIKLNSSALEPFEDHDGTRFQAIRFRYYTQKEYFWVDMCKAMTEFAPLQIKEIAGERNYGYWYEDKKQQMWKDFRVAVAVGMEVVRAKQLALFMIAFILRGTDFCPNSFQPRISIREFIYRLIDKVIEWKHIEGRRMDEGDDIPYVTRMLDHLTYWKVKNVHLVFPNCPLAALT